MENVISSLERETAIEILPAGALNARNESRFDVLRRAVRGEPSPYPVALGDRLSAGSS